MEKPDNELILVGDTCEEDRKRRRLTDKLRWKLPFFSGEIAGQHVVFAIVLLFVIAPVITGLYLHHEDSIRVNGLLTYRLKKLEESSAKSNETLEAMIYVISLSQQDREKLNLVKPAIIRELERR